MNTIEYARQLFDKGWRSYDRAIFGIKYNMAADTAKEIAEIMKAWEKTCYLWEVTYTVILCDRGYDCEYECEECRNSHTGKMTVTGETKLQAERHFLENVVDEYGYDLEQVACYKIKKGEIYYIY